MTSFARYLSLIAGLAVAQPVWGQEDPVEKQIKDCQIVHDATLDPENLLECLYTQGGNRGMVAFYQRKVQELTGSVDGTYHLLSHLNGGCEGSKNDFLANSPRLMEFYLQGLEMQLEEEASDLLSFEPYQEAKVAARRDLQRRIDRVADYSCN